LASRSTSVPMPCPQVGPLSLVTPGPMGRKFHTDCESDSKAKESKFTQLCYFPVYDLCDQRFPNLCELLWLRL
jgi:hypothetical protein